MKLRRLIAVVVFAGLLPLVQASAAGASCQPLGGLEDELAGSAVAFIGKVAAVDTTRTQATVRVLSVWKGPDLPTEVAVTGGFDGEVSMRTYNPGATYIFMPTTRQPPFIDDLCSATRFYSGPSLVIPPYLADAVGTDTARMPLDAEETTAGDTPLVPIAIGTLILLTIVGLIVLYGRTVRVEPKRRPTAVEKPIFKPVRKRRGEGKVKGFTRSGSRAARKHAKAKL